MCLAMVDFMPKGEKLVSEKLPTERIINIPQLNNNNNNNKYDVRIIMNNN